MRPWGCRALQLMLGRGMAPSPSSVSGGGNLLAVGWAKWGQGMRRGGDGREKRDDPKALNTVVLHLDTSIHTRVYTCTC